jgi:hypothetical protein
MKTTFRHDFGSGLKPGKFRHKIWFAVVVEPSPGKYMLLFSREPTDVELTVEGKEIDFDTLEPDGQKSHWLKMNRKMREAAGAEAGDVVSLEITSVEKEPEPQVPADLRKALAAAPQARQLWSDITPVARRDWIHWITSAKQSETRARRIKNACEMLASGKRRVCCFDRSGYFSKSFCAPRAAE